MIGDRMTGRATRAAELMAMRLGGAATLSRSDLELIETTSRRLETAPVGSDVPGRRILVSGWVARRRTLDDGSRQIFGFLLPGDPLKSRGRRHAGLAALTPVETAEASALFEAAEASLLHSGLTEGFEAIRDEEERLLLDHIVRLGKLTAYERTAHLLLELRERLARVGLADDQRLPMPLTQETLADALGLSIVHVNRTVQQLRRDGMLELRSGVATLPAPEALAHLCGYQPLRAPRPATGPAAPSDAPREAAAPLG